MTADPRHLHRIDLVKALFSWQFNPSVEITPELQAILDKLSDIDPVIQTCAPAWPLPMMNQVDLAILRVAVYELEYAGTPEKVAIDEAIEIAKEFGAANSAKFVNGVLASILKQHQQTS